MLTSAPAAGRESAPLAADVTREISTFSVIVRETSERVRAVEVENGAGGRFRIVLMETARF
jgi:hypothetical protein